MGSNINNKLDEITKRSKVINLEEDYKYILEVSKLLINNILNWNSESISELVYSLQKVYSKINDGDYLDYIKNNAIDDYDIMRIFIKNINAEEELISILKLYINNTTLKDEYIKVKSDLEKKSILINNNKLNFVINLDKIINTFKKVQMFLLYCITKPAFIFKDVWLIGERSNQAEDNGYVFFKYCRENHPEKPIYYIIEKNSKQALKLKKLGNIIYRGTLKHKIYLLHANKYISAYHFFKFSTLKSFNKFQHYYMKYIKATRIFLQHGVTMNKPYSLNRYVGKHDYIIIPTSKEENLFVEEYGYKNTNLLKTGMARFDNLIDTSNMNEKKILFMPTWRADLKNMSDKMFMQSEYYRAVNSLLTNKELNNILEKNKIKLVFYLHYEMQKFIKCFNTHSKNIECLDINNSIVQELLKSCNLLITDLSSVGCDFSFMDKPVIFYQFSKENFHYEINLDTRFNTYDDFGKVVLRENDVIDLIKKWINSSYKNITPIKENIYFYLNDRNNCKRIYDEIERLPKKRVENEFEVEIKDEDNNIVEKRYYDRNFNFKKRDYFRKDGSKRMTLFYKDSYIFKGYLYNEEEKLFAEYKYYKNIIYKKKYYTIMKDNKKHIEFIQHKNGNLKYKIIYFNDGKTLKNKTQYRYEGGSIMRNELYYSTGELKRKIIYNENGKPIEAFFYDKDGNKERYYQYYVSGKVKNKIFYNNMGQLEKEVVLSEIDESIIKVKKYIIESEKNAV